MKYKIALPAFLAVLGLFTLFAELSGFTIVSQTCCFGENCNPENMCSPEVLAKNQSQPRTATGLNIPLGAAFIFMAGLSYIFLKGR